MNDQRPNLEKSKLGPCPKCGAPVEPHEEDLSADAVAYDVQPDTWVECTKCDYATSVEFHPK